MIRLDHASLADATAAALERIDRRTVFFENGGQRYVVKRAADRQRSFAQTLIARWIARLMTGQSLPARTVQAGETASALDYEARRLEQLARAGVRVPRIVLRGPGYLLFEHCGASVANELEIWPAEDRRRELDRLARELGEFHVAGHWHGAAQIKNLTLKDGQSFRIDFEEDFGEGLPRPAAQAFDLALFLNSVAMTGPVDAAESRALLPLLLRTYFAANPDVRVREVLEKARPWLAGLARLAAPVSKLNFGGRRRKGAARVAVLAGAITAYLESGPKLDPRLRGDDDEGR